MKSVDIEGDFRKYLPVVPLLRNALVVVIVSTVTYFVVVEYGICNQLSLIVVLSGLRVPSVTFNLFVGSIFFYMLRSLQLCLYFMWQAFIDQYAESKFCVVLCFCREVTGHLLGTLFGNDLTPPTLWTL